MKAMKKVMIVTIAMVILLGISDKALAGPWTRSAFGLGARHRSVFGLVRSHRLGLRPVLGRRSCTRSAFGLGRYGRYGGYGGYGRYDYGDDSTLGKVLRYVRPGMNIVGGLHQMSVDNRVVNHQISMDNQAMDMAKEEQRFRHGQHRIIGARSNTVLRTTIPVRRIIKIKPEKTQKNENQELQQKIKLLELELKKLQQQVGK